jgi:hypothetical protein
MRRVIITEEIQEVWQGPPFLPRPVKRSWGRKLHRAAVLVLALLWLGFAFLFLAAVTIHGRSPLALLWPVFPAFAASVFLFRPELTNGPSL